VGGQGGGASGSEVSIDTQTGFDGDTGQQEMGWTAPAVDSGSRPDFSDSAMQGGAGAHGPAQSAPQRPEAAPPRMPEAAPTGAPAPAPEKGPEHGHQAAGPESRPHVVWSSAPPTQGEHGVEGPPRDE
jgi:hypothetical protein